MKTFALVVVAMIVMCTLPLEENAGEFFTNLHDHHHYGNHCPDTDVVAVPEPGTMGIIAVGLTALLVARRNRG